MNEIKDIIVDRYALMPSKIDISMMQFQWQKKTNMNKWYI